MASRERPELTYLEELHITEDPGGCQGWDREVKEDS